MSEILYIEDIKRIIPHRYPFLLIDKVTDIVLNKSCVGHKNVTNNEWYFQGHFPDNPIMPGVLIIEAMAQAACVLSLLTMEEEGATIRGESKLVYFTSVDFVKFKKPVVPGDVLSINVNVEQRRSKFWKYSAQAYVGDVLADEAEFRAMVP